jgi:osmotically-inducible protein OsmY
MEINALGSLPEYRQDYELEVDADEALWSNEILRNTDYPEIGVDVQDGTVRLRGHVFNALNKNRVEVAIRTVPGILSIEDCLVVDQELATQVAQALRCTDLTASEKIMVKVEHGFITLTGQVSDTAVSEAAGKVAASLPQVRGVANFLRAPGIAAQPQRQQFWQPRIGEEVYATDTRLGEVEQVVINPNNRCVTAFVTHVIYPDLYPGMDDEFPDETNRQERHVVIPTSAIRYDGDSAICLQVSGAAAAQNRDVSSLDFVYPPENWQPPYPYDPGNVLFEGKASVEPNEFVLSQSHDQGSYAR